MKGAVCIYCGKWVAVGGFFDERLIHIRRDHPNINIGLGWSFLQKRLVW